MTTPTTAEQVENVLREFSEMAVGSAEHAMASELVTARATIARLEASNRDLEAAVHTYRKSADAAQETIARLEGERDKAVEDLADVVAGRVGVKEIMVRDGKMTMTMHTEMASVLADSLAAMLDHGNAENYVEMDMRGSDGKRYTVIVRRAERPTPHELHMKAVAERDAERTRADAAERRVEAVTGVTNAARVYVDARVAVDWAKTERDAAQTAKDIANKGDLIAAAHDVLYQKCNERDAALSELIASVRALAAAAGDTTTTEG